MTSLAVILIFVIVFAIGAIKNWGRVIGAGPTILIVGAILVIGYVGIQYSAFLDDQRAYDACSERVARSVVGRNFNDTLIEIIDEEISDRPDIVKRLKDAELPVLNILSCGRAPSFLGSHNNEVDR